MPATPPETPYDAIRPYAILAVAALALGFATYVALDRPALVAAVASHTPVAAEPTANAPGLTSPAADDWNLPKKI